MTPRSRCTRCLHTLRHLQQQTHTCRAIGCAPWGSCGATWGLSQHKRDGRWAHCRVKKWATTGTIILVGPSAFLDAMEGLSVKKASVHQVEIMFEKAASACAAGRCRIFEASSNERLARLFCQEVPYTTKRLKYLQRAADLYRSWGAVAKSDE